MFYLSIFLAVGAMLLLRNKIKNRFVLFCFSFGFFLLLFISGFYYVANYYSGQGIDESVIYHLTMSVEGAGLGEFSLTIAFIIVYLLLILLLSFYFYFKNKNKNKNKNDSSKKSFVLIGFILMGISFYINPGVLDIKDIYKNISNKSSNIDYPESYIIPKNINLKEKKKNFVYIYLESVEDTYFNEEVFPELLPELKEIKSESISFSDIRDVYGSGWTVAGMVNSQCGIPLVTPGGANSMSGADRFLPEAICIGDVLKKENYNLNYIGGADLSFAGKGNFYEGHGFNQVDGFHELIDEISDPEYKSNWGLYDDSLFEIAKNRFDYLAEQEEPFGLFVLTLDTHHPRGHISSYCADTRYEEGADPILNAIHCTDRLASDFINYIRSSEAYDNTVIIVSSDHLAINNTIYEKLLENKRRNFLMFLDKSIEAKEINKPGALIDVAPTILDLLGADIEGFGFGRNLFKSSPTLTESSNDVDDLLLSHRNFLSSLWSFPQIKKGLSIDAEHKKIQLGDREINYPALIVLDENLDVEEIIFDSYYGENISNQITSFSFDKDFIWIDSCEKTAILNSKDSDLDGSYCLSYGALGATAIDFVTISENINLLFLDIKDYFDHIDYDKSLFSNRMNSLNAYNLYGTLSPILYTSESSNELQGELIIVSAGGSDNGPTIIKNIENNDFLEVNRGLSLFGFDAAAEPIELASYDTCENSVQDIIELNHGFKEDIDLNKGSFGAFAVIAADSAVCEPQDLSSLFIDTGLVEWDKIDFRTPYIGIITGDGDVVEFNAGTEEKIAVKAKNFIRPLSM